MSTVVVQVRVDEELRAEAASIFEQLGFDLPTAVRMFLAKVAQERALPFSLALPERDYKAYGAIHAMREISEEAQRNGTAEMSPDEIDAEISAVRRER